MVRKPQHFIDAKTKRKIAALTRKGCSQKEIVNMLDSSRSTIHRIQKSLELGLQDRVRLGDELQTEILAALQRGTSHAKISKALGVKLWAIRKIARAHNIHPRAPVPEEKLLSIISAIANKTQTARDIALAHGVNYRKVLFIAHKVLDCAKFIGGNAKTPLATYLPPAETKVDDSLILVNEISKRFFRGQLPADSVKFALACVDIFVPATMPTWALAHGMQPDEWDSVRDCFVLRISDATDALKSSRFGPVH
jgi:hypothetical protein